ncbi:phosphate acyltransferase PlsX [Opitutus sp. GAS368]|uniref:phosphate acyltransferase PlsX n=1 Tax=Opitutus sp. GAS368 TaxID=1882749 RepID=UPI00210198C1|nr:phosphate acyltransferase PlsX [Opitutus sp. GAS368]
MDAMGGDLGPSEVIEAVKLALADPDIDPITLIGDQAVLEPLLAAAGLSGHARLSVVHASEAITMEDKPLRAIAKKKDSSMVRGFNLVKEGKAGALVSSGNTGALMAGSKLIVGSITGVDRPVLAAVIPRENGHFILIDAGANPEAKPEHLVHNAILGADYARVILGIDNPRVGLLTIGTEEGKGTALTTEANTLLKKVNGIINYAGPIEGFQVFKDTVDVVVCDGFVGNTLLKTWESLAKFISGMLRDEIQRNPMRLLGGALAKGAFDVLKARMNPDRYGGAPLLGVKGNVLKAHGSSNRHAWNSAIHAAAQIIHQDLYHRIETDVARANVLMATPPAADAAAG